ncbi:MAG: hypothetical protein SGJ20_13420 [Planctomycetota bacterium]|nr:hypothetical protein [Planctomycetota bacterium]
MYTFHRQIACRLLICIGTSLAAVNVYGQSPKVHYQHAGALPPGAVGANQLLRGGPLPGYFQPVEIKAPAGAQVSLAINQQFTQPQANPFKVGLLIAPVYRLRVTNIHLQPGAEVYPTIEIINRLYSPVGEEFRFPIPIELTQADLELALDGKFVTRVIYLENPHTALPIAQDAKESQQYFEVRATDDPLAVADQLGRPMAILRIGGRLPDAAGPDEKFMYGSPMLLVPRGLKLWPTDEDRQSISKLPTDVAAGDVRQAFQPDMRPTDVASANASDSSPFSQTHSRYVSDATVMHSTPDVPVPRGLKAPAPVVPGPLVQRIGTVSKDTAARDTANPVAASASISDE